MTTKEQLVLNFAQILADEGETFFTSGDIDKDYLNITSTLDAQGYWAGVRYRLYFDSDYKLVKVEGRTFG